MVEKDGWTRKDARFWYVNRKYEIDEKIEMLDVVINLQIIVTKPITDILNNESQRHNIAKSTVKSTANKPHKSDDFQNKNFSEGMSPGLQTLQKW